MAHYYALLGVPPRSTPEEIRRAYRRLARRHHPDSSPEGAHSAPLFQQIHEAYRALTEQKYDAARGLERPGLDCHVTLAITLEEAVRGGSYLYRGTRRLDLPPGLRAGERLRLPGEGSVRDGKRGDLYVFIAYAPHAGLRVAGAALHTELVLMPWEAALGIRRRVPTPEGAALLAIPPGTRAGARFTLPGRGLPRARGGRGDLHVTVAVRTPSL
ncbi:MAG: DnaJ C-terminal domain-containing protein [Verrucomicrobium sp.]|nr:DnaJ C-terminal domain-containing protein [Verrucomicrobium sp.]